MKTLIIILSTLLFYLNAPPNTTINIVTGCQFKDGKVIYWVQKRHASNPEGYTYYKLVKDTQIYNIGDTLNVKSN